MHKHTIPLIHGAASFRRWLDGAFIRFRTFMSLSQLAYAIVLLGAQPEFPAAFNKCFETGLHAKAAIGREREGFEASSNPGW